MPEFKLNYGSPEARMRFKALDAFTQGYIEAMFFTADEELGEPWFEELSEEALKHIATDCQTFQERAGRALDALPDGYDLEAAGRDFWFTRNHHGVGFWSRDVDLPPELDAVACRFGECDLYRGDDERLYL